MTTTMTPADKVTEALAIVYTDYDKYVDDIAKEFTVSNLGQELRDFAHYASPATLVCSAYNELYNGAESDEMARGVRAEYRSWVKEAKKMARAVDAGGDPWTLKNARDQWLKLARKR